MNVLYLCYREQGLSIGGTGEVFYYLSSLLPRYGTHVYLCTPGRAHGLKPQNNLGNGTPCYFTRPIKPGRFLWLQQTAITQLTSLIKDLKIDLLHAQGLYRPGFTALILKKITNIPYVITSHGDILPKSTDRLTKLKVRKRCQDILKHANAVTHLTSFMAEIAHDIYDTSDKSFMIPNGIAVERWQAVRQHEQGCYLLCVGRLIPEKGFAVIIDAYAALVKLGLQLPLVIAGIGPDLDRLMQQAEQHQLKIAKQLPDDLTQLNHASVYLPGYIGAEKKYQLYAHAKMVLFPTQPHLLEEAFGMVILESMAAGKPFIMSRLKATGYFLGLGVQADIVDNAENPQAWADKIGSLLNDTARMQLYSKKNLQLIEQFSWDKITLQYQQVYEKCLL